MTVRSQLHTVHVYVCCMLSYGELTHHVMHTTVKVMMRVSNAMTAVVGKITSREENCSSETTMVLLVSETGGDVDGRSGISGKLEEEKHKQAMYDNSKHSP